MIFFFNVTATTAIYTYGHTLSLNDALPIYVAEHVLHVVEVLERVDELEDLRGGLGIDRDVEAGDELDLGRVIVEAGVLERGANGDHVAGLAEQDRKSTRLNSSH